MRARVALVGVVGLLFLAAPAHATLYCVPDATGCGNGAVAKPTLQIALDSAEAAGDDIVMLQDGTYTGNFVYDPSLADAGNLEVGPRLFDATLRSTTANGTTLKIEADSNDSSTKVINLTIEAPTGGYGLWTEGDVSGGDVVSASGAQGATGVVLGGSGLMTGTDVRMADNGQPANLGVLTRESLGAGVGPAMIEASTIDAQFGLHVDNGTSLHRSSLVTSNRGIYMSCAGSLDIDSVVHTMTGGLGLDVRSTSGGCGSPTPSIVDVRNLTFVSEQPFLGPALSVTASGGGDARIRMRSSIVVGFDTVLQLEQSNDPGTTADIEVDHSLIDLTRIAQPSNGGAANLGGNFVGDPMFADAPARNYTLLWHSPAIDAGHPLFPGPGQATTDIAGHPRTLDGDGDGTMRRDVGALEYVGPAPRVSVSPNPVEVGQAVTFDASATTFYFGPIGFAWTWDDGGTAGNSATASHAFATPGTHTGTVKVNDHGLVATQPFSVVVNAPPAAEKPGEPGTPSTPSNPSAPSNPSTSVADTAAPSLTAKLLKKRFTRKKGGTLQLQLSEPATVSVLVERCTELKRRRCTRYQRASSKTVKSPQGTSRVALKGLRTGLHRVRVQATDAAGNRSAQRTAAFTVTR